MLLNTYLLLDGRLLGISLQLRLYFGWHCMIQTSLLQRLPMKSGTSLVTMRLCQRACKQTMPKGLWLRLRMSIAMCAWQQPKLLLQECMSFQQLLRNP
ncbi:hypothetical protein KC19_12G190500 [Ceratodon purpureus]|uniref:Uncharacterized protein n=1 Tax=Ceratodon purpureus TaxID=3225 RepID=A0A8T0GD12_CERPU|nr:hypothetical protein KC19_12G190500 [Ceratodon purpureus]